MALPFVILADESLLVVVVDERVARVNPVVVFLVADLLLRIVMSVVVNTEMTVHAAQVMVAVDRLHTSAHSRDADVVVAYKKLLTYLNS